MSLSCLIAAMTSSDRPLTKASGLASCAHASGTKAHMSKNEKSLDFISAAVDVVGRVDHLEQRHAREVARSKVSVVHRQDRSSDQCKRVCQQARANEARGAFRDRVRQRQTRGQAQQLPRNIQRMRQVVFAPDPAYDPFGRNTRTCNPFSSERRTGLTPAAMSASTMHRGSGPSSSGPTYIDTWDQVDCVMRLTSAATRVLPSVRSTSP